MKIGAFFATDADASYVRVAFESMLTDRSLRDIRASISRSPTAARNARGHNRFRPVPIILERIP